PFEPVLGSGRAVRHRGSKHSSSILTTPSPRPCAAYPCSCMASPLVSALVVNHNTKGRLKECLEAFYKSSDVPVEVVVVDCNSKDGSADGLEGRFENVRVLRQRRNPGFVRASNLGVQECNGRFV